MIKPVLHRQHHTNWCARKTVKAGSQSKKKTCLICIRALEGTLIWIQLQAKKNPTI
jgi:hypothetical protein